MQEVIDKNINKNYQKIKSLKLKKQIIKMKNIFNNNTNNLKENNNINKIIYYSILSMLIFIKDFLLKKFK